MTRTVAAKRSEYMAWAKTGSRARFNLATSGIFSVPRAEFPAIPEDLEINAPGGYGYAPLQERLARHTGASAESVVAATGTSMANHLAMATLLAPGDEVLIEQPTYGPLLDLAHYLGARVKRFPRRFETGFAIQPAEVEKVVTPRTRLIVLCNLHNPSGALVDAETMRELGRIAQRVGAHVLVDEVYLEMPGTECGDTSPPFAFPQGASILPDAADNPFVVTSSLTKVYGLSGLRCGWVLAAPELARRMWRLNDLFAATAAHPAEQMSVAACEALGSFRARTRALLAANRPLLDGFLDAHPELSSVRPPAGTVVFPRLPDDIDPPKFFTHLREKYETSVVPGDFFEMPAHFRLGIGGDTASLRAGLERLGAALDDMRRK